MIEEDDDLESMWDESEPVERSGFDEEGFRDWYDRWATVTGSDPDPDSPAHELDFRAAYLEGAEPEYDEERGSYVWPDRYRRGGGGLGAAPALQPAGSGAVVFGKPSSLEASVDQEATRSGAGAALATTAQDGPIGPSESRFAPAEDLASMWEEAGKIPQSTEHAAEAGMRASGTPWTRPEHAPGLWEALKTSAADTYETTGRLLKGASVLAQRAPSIVADYIPETVGRALRGGKKTVADQTWLDRWIEENRLEGEKAKKITPEEEQELWFTMPFTGQKVTLGDADKAAKSIGYSVANMLAMMAGGAVGGLAGAAAGGATGGPAGAAGGALAGRIAGGTVTGTIFSGEATKDEFIDEIQRAWLAARGNPKTITPALEREWQEIYKSIESDADWYGFWEAFPETVGNMLTLGIAGLGRKAVTAGPLASIKNRIAEQVGKSVAARIGLPVGKAAAMLTEESLTEAWTQYKQAQIEAELGIRDKAPTFEEAFLEVLPQTVINTAVMGPFAAGVSKVAERGAEAKAKAKHDQALGRYVESLQEGLRSGTIADGDVFELTMGLDWSQPALAPLKEVVGAPVVEAVRANVEAGHVNAEDLSGMLGRMNKAHPAYEEVRKLADELGASEAGAQGFSAATEAEIGTLRKHLAQTLAVKGEEEIVVRPAAGNRQRELVQQAGAAFGRRVVFYRGEGASDQLNGLYEPGTDTIYINERAENPYLVVLGHESLHRLRARHGDLYKQLVEAAKGADSGFEAWLKRTNASRKAAGLREMTAEDALAREEHLADFAGQQFADPKFWARIDKHDADLGKRLAGYVHEILEKIRAFLRRMGAAPQYFAQVNRVQDALASVYTEFARRERQVADGTAQPVGAARPAAEQRAARTAPVRKPSAAPEAQGTAPSAAAVAPPAGRTAPSRTIPDIAAAPAGTPVTEDLWAAAEPVAGREAPTRQAPAREPAKEVSGKHAEERKALAGEKPAAGEAQGKAIASESRPEPRPEIKELPAQETEGAAPPAEAAAPQKPQKRRPKKPAAPGKEKVRTLRGRIKQLGGINFLNFTGELRDMPIAVKFLSKKSAMGVDQVEQILRDEGWIGPEESLLDVLLAPGALKRPKLERVGVGEAEKRPEEMTEQEKRFRREMEWEPEEPPEGRYVTMRAEDLPEGKKLAVIENRTRDGWDIYRVVEKDPFGVTLRDGTEITLAPGDLVEVRQADLKKAVAAEEGALASVKSAAKAIGVRHEALRAMVDVQARKTAGGRKGLKAARAAILESLEAEAKAAGENLDEHFRRRALNFADPLRGLYAEILDQRAAESLWAEAPAPEHQLVQTRDVRAWEQGNYVSPSGEVFQSSRTVPMPAYPWTEGTWRVDDHFGPYGRMVEVLRRVPVDALQITEEDYTKGPRTGRAEDADRYAGWLREGKTAPPIEVLESDLGNLLVTNGHRRLAAAKMAGRQTILAWVSPRMDTKKKSYEGNPIYTAATYEGLTLGVERAKRLYEERQKRRREEAEALGADGGERFATAADKVIAGEAESVGQASAPWPEADLKRIEVDVPAVDERGNAGVVRMRADEALKESDRQLDFARRLFACLKD